MDEMKSYLDPNVFLEGGKMKLSRTEIVEVGNITIGWHWDY